MSYLAHVTKNESAQNGWKIHSLVQHLEDVAYLAKTFADEFQSGEWAYLAGLWHDLGKFSEEFQSYIKSASGYDQEAHLEENSHENVSVNSEMKGRVNHSSAGALLAVKTFGPAGRIIAYLIASHHTGLLDWSTKIEGAKALSFRLNQNELLEKSLVDGLPKKLFGYVKPKCSFKLKEENIALWIRMLFSCLVDADFLDTERFMQPDQGEMRGVYPTLLELDQSFKSHMTNLTNKSTRNPINLIRSDILSQCRKKAELEPGLFSLTVPTGGGKTLSSMAFALTHALKYNKKRIIYVIPYTSIIEQTADVLRQIFKDGVVEHHSNFDATRETQETRIAKENWDAPIIVTTSVQFFESFFACSTSRVRKLHNVVNSVVIFDEVQQFPPNLLQPILALLQELSDSYNVTSVLATATQPAITENNDDSILKKLKQLKNVREIIDGVNFIYNSLKRVNVNFRDNLNNVFSWDTIAKELQRHSQVLCIVNTRRDCRELYEFMPEGTIHLSALMCGEHRSKIIRDIKQHLKNNEPIRVVSTQLVEAGVDIDFPIVYRAVAGVDSISQAAGRCNREGRRCDAGGNLINGEIIVFAPPKPSPPGHLRKAEEVTRELFKTGLLEDPLAPEATHRFFKNFYGKASKLGEDVIKLLKEGARDIQIEYRQIEASFKIIDDSKSKSLIVKYDNSEFLIKELERQAFSNQKIDKHLMRKLQRFTINIPKNEHEKLLKEGKICEINTTGIFVQTLKSLYCPIIGWHGELEPEDFIIY